MRGSAMDNREEMWFKKNARKLTAVFVFFTLMPSLQVFYFDSEEVGIPILIATVSTCLYVFVNWVLKWW